MEIKFADIVLAFEFVSSAPMAANVAVICKETGEILYKSNYGDEDEIPEEVYGREDCIGIPHKNELDLGRNLVFEFVNQYLPDDFERVRRSGSDCAFINSLGNRERIFGDVQARTY